MMNEVQLQVIPLKKNHEKTSLANTAVARGLQNCTWLQPKASPGPWRNSSGHFWHLLLQNPFSHCSDKGREDDVSTLHPWSQPDQRTDEEGHLTEVKEEEQPYDPFQWLKWEQ